jgi:hypothetical protein
MCAFENVLPAGLTTEPLVQDLAKVAGEGKS